MAGWSITATSGSVAAKLRADAGTSTTASHLSSGTGTASDRALGMLASGSYIGRAGLVLVNDTGGILTEFTLAYTGEQWRNGGSGTANKLAFEYAVDSSSIASGSYTAATALSFTSPVVGTTSGALDGNLSGNRTVITGTVTNVPWGPGQTLVLRWSDADEGGSDDALAIDDLSFSAVTGSLPVITRIHSVQGSGVTSPQLGNVVTVEGIVTGDFQGASPALGGFYMVEQAANFDADPVTSEGIFVSESGNYDVKPGDVVRVTGTVAEVSGVTTITSTTFIGVTGADVVPGAIVVSLPPATTSGLERYEGMLVQFNQTLTVTDVSSLGSAGELTLSSGGVIETPTESMDPNDSPASGTTSTGAAHAAAINAQESLNTRRKLVLDDASRAANPYPTPYLSAQLTRRCGDTLTTVAGYFSYASGENRLQPVGAVTFADSNPRLLSPPVVGGRLRVAGMNALNYFTTLGSRGASNAFELQRQQDKIVEEIVGLNADVVGLMEIENNGTTALDTLLNAVNAALGAAVYARVPEPSGTGGDLVRVAMIYKPEKLTPDAPSYTDSSSVWNRWPLAVAFTEVGTGARFVACVNHFKSKSGTGATGLDVDQNDGQGPFNDRRRQQAAQLLSFIATVQTAASTSNALVFGDLNAYSQEDPVDILRAGGLVDQTAIHAPGSYSYVFDGMRGHLDHALTTSGLSSQVTGVANWHINADEPPVLDYTLAGKNAAQQAINTGTAFRASDHDPVLVGLSLDIPPLTYATWASTIAWPVGAVTSELGDVDGDGLTNLEELFLSTDPLSPDAHLRPQGVIINNLLQYDYRCRNGINGYTLVPQWSDNLSTWNDLASGTVVSAVSSTTDVRRVQLDITGLSRCFVRFKIR